MNKIKKIFTSILLISLIFLSLPINMSRGALETAFDYVEEGETYEFKQTQKQTLTLNNYKIGELSSQNELVTKIDMDLYIEKVNEDEGYITIAKYYHLGYRHNYTENTLQKPNLDYNDEDNDGLVEFFSVNFYAPTLLLVPWANYSDSFSEFEEILANASDDLDEFSYTFDHNEDSQRIDLTIDYNEEAYFWGNLSEYQGSLVYDCRERITIYYNDFILSEKTEISEKEVETVKNETYLEDNDIICCQNSRTEISTKQQGFFDKYGLWIGIGAGVVIAIIAVAVVWKKKSGSYY